MARGGKDTNIIGDNGERYAAIRLTQGQLFDVIELGGKTPAFDLLCRINDAQMPMAIVNMLLKDIIMQCDQLEKQELEVTMQQYNKQHTESEEDTDEN